MDLIRLENITKTYHLGEVDVPVLNGVSLSIRAGEMVALMGASGSGKTTLMNILGCLDRPSAGRYWLAGQEMSRLAADQRAIVRVTKIGFVFQNFNLLPRATALQNVVMPSDYAPHRRVRVTARQAAPQLIERVGLTDRCDHEPSQMSGGQQQRVAIARALVNKPLLLLADEPTGNLDSHTSAEILRMFQSLNAEGLTIILVTHDPQVAAYAHRVIHIRDGGIDGEEVRSTSTVDNDSARSLGPVMTSSHSKPPDSPEALVTTTTTNSLAARRTEDHTQSLPSQRLTPHDASVAPSRHDRGWGTSLWMPSTLRTALDALRRNTLRSALTAIGVIIGVAAVIAMIEIGEGSKTAIQRTITNMGANTLSLQSGAAASSGVSYGYGSGMSLIANDALEIARQCPTVAAVALIVHARAQVIYGNRNWNPATSDGTTPAFLDVRDWQDMAEGQMFTDRDVQTANAVCVIGRTVQRELFSDESAVGKQIRIRNVPFKVIGVLSPKGASVIGVDQDDVVLAPWTTVKYRVAGGSSGVLSSGASPSDTANKLYPGALPLYPPTSEAELNNYPQLRRFANLDHILVRVTSAAEIPTAMAEVTSVLRERHRLRDGQPDDFSIRDMTEMVNTLVSTSELMGTLLLTLGLISLGVGGVGIMNIMLVSVTERTREIGLRMAVGGQSRHILRQFLVEAVLLCLFGGVLGVVAGRAVSIGVRSVMSWPVEPSLAAICAAVAVSATVGIAFGFYPAWKASRLDPIEALRYE